MNSGYAILKIKSDDLEALADDEPSRLDRFGQNLLMIKSGRVCSRNIVGFVHEKKYYFFREGKLIERKE